jgi:hypothetical protein
MPFSLLVKKLTFFLFFKIKFYLGWLMDIFFYRRINKKIEKHKLNFKLNIDEICVDSKFEYACENYLLHKFDLLGSGWLCVNSDDFNKNQSNSYKKIAWQKDFKSKFSWSNKTWYKFIKYGITNNLEQRLSQHRRYNGKFEINFSQFYNSGKDALNWEKSIKQKHGGSYVTEATMPDGWTETLSIEKLKELI